MHGLILIVLSVETLRTNPVTTATPRPSEAAQRLKSPRSCSRDHDPVALSEGHEQALARFRRAARAEYAQLATVADSLRAENSALKDELSRFENTLRSIEARAQRADHEHAQVRELLDARTQELAAIRSVMGPMDQLSERDIARKIEELNDEIFQLSALMADSLVPTARGDVEPKRMSDSKEAVLARLGETVYHALNVRDDAIQMAAVQLALQSTMCTWCGSVISSWSLSRGEFEGRMRVIYSTIVRSEGQAAASRWQAVFRRSISVAEKVTEKGMMGGLGRMMRTVLDVAGYEIEGGEVLSNVDEMMTAVLRLSVRLREDVGSFTSSDLQIRLMRPGQPYRDEAMEAEGEASARSGGVVACGVSLGLIRNGPGPNQHILVKPKVTLVSTFEEIALRRV
ncbi:hypothetical protein HDZ31DRAFT_65369 [Schizophyllum fasciatum]